ncbi:hypothetical protein SCOR_33180 [Sulfidibacter corallicola]|uniref:Uncharacterized protein n=1 Tax=Sulfidibacter corallicola TaxID=2818388 RepID=A0A8A4THT3_SULCO|nr:hypothetical protein [Sulfidibacter corallicola]QTD49609.1 hypothetical protein J3U87_28820 [Sulfidibacter corallicola]
MNLQTYATPSADVVNVADKLAGFMNANGVVSGNVTKRAHQMEALAADDGSLTLDADALARIHDRNDNHGKWRWSWPF